MPKRGVSSAQRKTRSSTSKGVKKTAPNSMNFKRFLGISVGGGKTDKTALAVLDYFPEHEKIFLNQIFDRIGPDKDQGADEKLITQIEQVSENVELAAFDAPTSLPKCISCRLKCPGTEKCKVSEVAWMRDMHRKRAPKKRPNKMFTPYTERCAEIFLDSQLEEPFNHSHALGSNASPLTARVQYLQRHLKAKVIEASPKVSVFRIGRSLRVAKSTLRLHRHSVSGEESREVFLSSLATKKAVFLYQQDAKLLVQKGDAFDAFILALTAYLKYQGHCEKRAKGFPRAATWIDFPSTELSW